MSISFNSLYTMAATNRETLESNIKVTAKRRAKLLEKECRADKPGYFVWCDWKVWSVYAWNRPGEHDSVRQVGDGAAGSLQLSTACI